MNTKYPNEYCEDRTSYIHECCGKIYGYFESSCTECGKEFKPIVDEDYKVFGLFKTYKKYIISEIWKQRRDIEIKDKKKCELCGATSMLQVHHLTYDNLGNEKSKDLQVLCPPCHRKKHKK